jgi:hypothetical protein
MAIAVEGAAIRAEPWLWTAPTYDQVRIGWDETRHACGDAVKFNQERMTATFPGNGQIMYRSLDDPDNARGHTAAGVFVDEASEVKPAAWYEVIRPMLVDTGGSAWFLFTPKGRNWVWREWVNALEAADSACWSVPTLGCAIVDGALVRRPHPLENPAVLWPEVENLWRTTPERTFRQEILAEFIEGSGSVFRTIPACMKAPLTPEAHKGTPSSRALTGASRTTSPPSRSGAPIARSRLPGTASTRSTTTSSAGGWLPWLSRGASPRSWQKATAWASRSSKRCSAAACRLPAFRRRPRPSRR